MIEFGDNIYYIDLDALTNAIKSNEKTSVEKSTTVREIYTSNSDIPNSKEVTTTETPIGLEINMAKYETVRNLMDIVLDDNEIEDASLGSERVLSAKPLSYQIAFNTLLQYKILIEKEA